MMPQWHYEQAEKLLEQAGANEFHGDAWLNLRRELVAVAHVHALLATAPWTPF